MRTPAAAAPPYAMTCSTTTPRDFDPRYHAATVPPTNGRPDPVRDARGFGFGATPPPFYAVYKQPSEAAAAATAASDRRATTQTLIVAFFVLLCLFSCAMTVALLYQSHAETHRQIEEVISDLKAFTNVVRDELVTKRAIVDQYQQLRQKQQQRPQPVDHENDDPTNVDYKDLLMQEDDHFMGVYLDGNRRPSGNRQRLATNVGGDAEANVGGVGEEANVGSDGRRRRRSAAIDMTKTEKNELNRSTPDDSPLVPLLLTKTLDVLNHQIKYSKKFADVLKTFTSSANEKPSVELIQNESDEGNKVPTQNQSRKGRQKKLLGPYKSTDITQHEQLDEDDGDSKSKQLAAAAHFSSDSSKYSSKTHTNYHGNGRIRHPDGAYRDWSQHVWNGHSNVNHFQLKDGIVEVSTPGVYFVYAQIYYSDQHDVNGYVVMKNNEKVLGCTTTRHQEFNRSDSCYTAGLIYFNANDVLSIKGIDMERYIILDPIRSFFGLFEVAKHFK